MNGTDYSLSTHTKVSKAKNLVSPQQAKKRQKHFAPKAKKLLYFSYFACKLPSNVGKPPLEILKEKAQS